MFQAFRRAILRLTAKADARANEKAARRFVAAAARGSRAEGGLAGFVDGMEEIARVHEDEVSTWVSPKALTEGSGGPFDACDLRHWLALAERAGVPFVPARQIAVVEEGDMALLSGGVDLPEGRAMEKLRSDALELARKRGIFALPPSEGERDYERLEALKEALSSAMDAVPEGWMVRSARCGSSELKTLAGVGAAGPTVPEVRFGPDLEVGPGWVRVGNRRRVRVSDARTVESYAQGPGGPCAFLARPWVEADRYAVGEDPHRHGSVFAGKGAWPAEWRAFVEKGKVIGVASYYGWCGSVTPENARIAIQVRDLAQRIADEASRIRAWPRYMDIEFARLNKHPKMLAHSGIQQALETLGRDDVACTLDFIEAKDSGLMLLEGGPPVTPFGGGHPCAFAGCGGKPVFGARIDVEGVAFRMMPHVLMTDPSTWVDGDRAECVLGWEEVERLSLDK